MVVVARGVPAGMGSLLALCAMVFFPFLNPFHRFPIASFHSEWLAVFFGLLASLFFLRQKNWVFVVIPRSVWVPLVLCGLAVLQTGWLALPRTEFNYIFAAYLLFAMVLMILGASLVNQIGMTRLVDWLAWALVLGATVAGLFSLIQGFKLSTVISAWVPAVGDSRPFGALAQANHQGNYLAVGLAACLYLGYTRGRWMILALLPAAFVMATGLAMSASRTSFLYLAGFIGLSVWMWWKTRSSDSDSRRMIWLTTGLLLFFLLIQWAIPYLREMLSESGGGALVMPSSRLFAESAGYSLRLRVWHESVLMALKAPLLGVGIGQFSWHHFLIAKDMPPHMASAELFNHAHNLFLHLLAELGVFAALTLVAGVVAFVSALRSRQATPSLWFLLAVLVIQAAHSMLEYPLWYSFFLGLSALVVGAADGKTYRFPIVEQYGRAIFVPIFVCGIAVFSNISSSSTELDGIADEVQHGGFTEKDLPNIVDSLTLIREGSLMAPYVDAIYSNAITVVPGKNQREELAVNSRTVTFWPQPQVVARQLLLLALNQRDAEARVLMQHALSAYPGFLSLLGSMAVNIPLNQLGGVGQMLALRQRVIPISVSASGVVAQNQ